MSTSPDPIFRARLIAGFKESVNNRVANNAALKNISLYGKSQKAIAETAHVPFSRETLKQLDSGKLSTFEVNELVSRLEKNLIITQARIDIEKEKMKATRNKI